MNRHHRHPQADPNPTPNRRKVVPLYPTDLDKRPESASDYWERQAQKAKIAALIVAMCALVVLGSLFVAYLGGGR
jgi:hypothetical protein